MAKQLPIPRPVPSRVGYGVPQSELYAACERFWKDLERADKIGRADAAALSQALQIEYEYHGTWEVELYASAIHIFAAMTVEAVMNVFAVVRFGEQHFNAHFRYGPPITRLRKILYYLPQIDLSDDSEIAQLIKRLFKVRDDLVHAKSAEDFYDEQHRPIREREDLVVTKETAADALADLRRFVNWISQLDQEVESFIQVW